jgi:NADH-ubiquinone oxidoreductase chain 1
MESELVSGFMTEHSAIIFVFFFLAEYASIVLISALVSILFLGGYLLPTMPYGLLDGIIINPLNTHGLYGSFFEGLMSGVVLGFKTCIIVFMFIWVRASFPRIRYDQLMSFCWTELLPLIFAFIFISPTILISFDAAPFN